MSGNHTDTCLSTTFKTQSKKEDDQNEDEDDEENKRTPTKTQEERGACLSKNDLDDFQEKEYDAMLIKKNLGVSLFMQMFLIRLRRKYLSFYDFLEKHRKPKFRQKSNALNILFGKISSRTIFCRYCWKASALIIVCPENDS